MIKSNGAYFTAAGVDMILLTYSDIEFSPGSLTAIERVGWKMRQVRSNVICAWLILGGIQSSLQLKIFKK